MLLTMQGKKLISNAKEASDETRKVDDHLGKIHE